MSTFTELIGQELGPTEWLDVDQERIDRFADATGDHQWIHVDAERAAEGPFGTTIAHGYLTLSLLPLLMSDTLNLTGYRMGINYGVNKVRFPAPVPSGSRIRATFTVQSVEEVPGGERDGRLDVGARGDVAADRTAADPLCRLGGRRLVEVCDDDVRTLAREPLGGCGADPAGAAGDEERPVVERPARHADNPIPLDTRGSPRP